MTVLSDRSAFTGETVYRPARQRANLPRAALWGTCLGIVIAVHLALFLGLGNRPKPAGETPLPPVMMIDLPPLPAPLAPPMPTAAIKPRLEQQVVQPGPAPLPKVPTPPQPQTPPAPAPQFPPPPVPKMQSSAPAPAPPPVARSDASLPLPPLLAPQPPPQRPYVAPSPRKETASASSTTAALSPPATLPARVARPPASALQPAARGSSKQDWQSLLLARIARFKNYPANAQDNGWQGTSILRFTFTRNGTVMSVVLVRSSGHADLDAAAIATVRRASPLPPAPESVSGDPITLTLPLQFSLDLE